MGCAVYSFWILLAFTALTPAKASCGRRNFTSGFGTASCLDLNDNNTTSYWQFWQPKANSETLFVIKMVHLNFSNNATLTLPNGKVVNNTVDLLNHKNRSKTLPWCGAFRKESVSTCNLDTKSSMPCNITTAKRWPPSVQSVNVEIVLLYEFMDCTEDESSSCQKGTNAATISLAIFFSLTFIALIAVAFKYRELAKLRSESTPPLQDASACETVGNLRQESTPPNNETVATEVESPYDVINDQPAVKLPEQTGPVVYAQVQKKQTE